MKKNSTQALSESLQAKAKQDSEQMQGLQQEQLKQLVQSLKSTLESELYTTQQDIRKTADYLAELTKKKTEELGAIQQATLNQLTAKQAELTKNLDQSIKASQRALRWGWLRATVPSLSVLAIILAGSWGLITYGEQKAKNLYLEILEAQEVMRNLPKNTKHISTKEGNFLIFEQRKEPDVYKTQNGHWALKLNN